MPTTYNGIGTHYYGKRNLQSRPGVCPHCRHSLALLSYDTRLWFVIFFIPVIPLGRKRVMDKCPACSWHYVAELQKWETARQLEISGALEKFRSTPTPETAIEAHRQLVIFHQLNEAEVFQKEMCEKFPDNARIQIYLALTLAQVGKGKEAEPFFQRALELRPDLPEARAGVAQIYIREKRLDDARALLDFMDKPGAAQLYSLAPLERLAIAYQEAGRHLQALPLFGRLLNEIPALAQNRNFRKTVQRSESGDRPSILPKAKFNLFKFLQQADASLAGNGQRAVSNRTLLVGVGCVLLLVAAGLMISNAYIQRHRTLYVVSPSGMKLHLEISGIDPVQMSGGLSEVHLPEGHYVAKVTGAIEEEIPFDIHAQYLHRWADEPAWVLNPGGRVLLSYVHVVYSRHPQPGSFRYTFGRNFESFSDVTHPFMSLPDSVTVSSGGDQKVLTALEVFRDKPLYAYHELARSKRNQEAFELAEWHLRLNPADKEMLRAYMISAASSDDLSRFENFLHAGITNRQTPIAWHRAYQDLCLYEKGKSRQLSEEYTALLKAEPTNSDLMYLCGRACEDRDQSTDYFVRARQAAPNNPYPMYALAYDQIMRGEWQEAMPSLDRVVELMPEDPDFRQVWKTACMASGQFDKAEKAYKDLIRKDAKDWQSTKALCDVFAAQGKQAEADVAISQMLRAIEGNASPKTIGYIRSEMQTRQLYAKGDFVAMEQVARRDRSPGGEFALFQALVEQNHFDEAAKVLPLKEIQDDEVLIAVSLALRLANRTAEADEWKAAFIQKLRDQGGHSEHLADCFAGKVELKPADLEEVRAALPYRAALLAETALTHPQLRGPLIKIASQINVERTFPYHLVQRAIASAP